MSTGLMSPLALLSMGNLSTTGVRTRGLVDGVLSGFPALTPKSDRKMLD